MKKCLMLLLTCLGIQAAQASQYTGFYVKGAAGAIQTQADIKEEMIVLAPSIANFYRPSHSKIQGNSGVGLLGIGYSHHLPHHFILGAEFTASLDHARSVQHNEFDEPLSSIIFLSEVEIFLENDFALLLKPGYLFGERTQIYGMIGPRWANVEVELSNTFGFGGVVFVTTPVSESAYSLGLSLGLGMEHLVTDNLVLGLEYMFTDYWDIEAPTVNVPIEVSGVVVGTIADAPDIDFITNSVMLTLSYRF